MAFRSASESAYPSKTISISVVAGDLIVIGFISGYSRANATCADNAGGGSNVYREHGTGLQGYGCEVHVWRAIAKATETITVTVTTANGPNCYLVSAIHSGMDQDVDAVLDGYNTYADPANATSHTTGSITTTNANDLLVTLFFAWSGGDNFTGGAGGFTSRIDAAGDILEDRTVSATGTYTGTVTSASTRADSFILAFKAAASGVTGSGGTTQPVQSISGAGTVPINGSGAITQRTQVISGAGTLPINGTGATTQRVQTISGSGASPINGSGGTTQPVQTIAGVGNVNAPSPINGSGGTTQPVQAIQGSGSSPAPALPLNGPPTAEIQTLTPGATWEGYVLDASALGGGITRLSNEVNQFGANVVWQGNAFTKWPIQGSGFEMTSKGTMPRPTIQVANIENTIAALIRAYGDLVGATLTRKRVLAKFLDAVNFVSGNASADSTAGFADDVFFVERKVTENQLVIEFELSAASDLQGMLIPRRVVQSSCCMWNDVTVCPYSVGGACAKTLDACKTHYPSADLPFGGFPGAGLS